MMRIMMIDGIQLAITHLVLKGSKNHFHLHPPKFKNLLKWRRTSFLNSYY